MPLLCTDGTIDDSDLEAWNAGKLDGAVQLTCAQVRAVFCGPCLSRAIALLDLTVPQIVRLFPSRVRRKNVEKLRRWGARLSGVRVRAVLANATWHQIRAAAAHEDEHAQIRAAMAYTLGIRPKRRSRP